VAFGNGLHCVGLFWQEYIGFFWCVLCTSQMVKVFWWSASHFLATVCIV